MIPSLQRDLIVDRLFLWSQTDVVFICRVPEQLTNTMIYQTLKAVNFCHQHNVCTDIVMQSE